MKKRKKLFHEVDFMKQPFFDKNSAENHDFFIIQQLFHKVYFVKQGIVPEDYMEHMIDKLITLKREGETNMKKILQLTKAITLTLAAVIMLLNTNVLTAYAQVMLPGMLKTEYGIMVTSGSGVGIDTKTGTIWSYEGYPFCKVTNCYSNKSRKTS